MSKTGSDTYKVLLRKALVCIDDLERRGVPVDWTLGGGTVLYLRYDHRLSRDIDVFLHDPQLITHLSPRLNESVAAIVDAYHEGSGSLKLALGEGAIDFIVAPSLLSMPTVSLVFEDREIATDASAEIVAKKLFYRASSLKVRDIIDLAVVLTEEPEATAGLQPLVEPKRTQLLRRLDALEPTFDRRVTEEVALLPAGERFRPTAMSIARSLFEGSG